MIILPISRTHLQLIPHLAGSVKAVLMMGVQDPSYSGAYTCNAVNSKGSATVTGIITVFGKSHVLL